jgi:hypothetical protein
MTWDVRNKTPIVGAPRKLGVTYTHQIYNSIHTIYIEDSFVVYVFMWSEYSVKD